MLILGKIISILSLKARVQIMPQSMCNAKQK